MIELSGLDVWLMLLEFLLIGLLFGWCLFYAIPKIKGCMKLQKPKEEK